MTENGNGHLRLNIGSGDRLTLKGYVNVDAKFGDAAYPLKYEDGSVHEIYASHVLEHFPQREIGNVLKDWTRVLKPGGVLKVAVPDFKWIAERYLAGANGTPLSGYLMGGQTDENDFHKAVFDEPTLWYALADAGLTDIQPWKSEINDCASLPVSLNLMGRKPEATASNAPMIVDAQPGKVFVAGQWREVGTAPGQVALEQVEVAPIGIATSTPRYGSLLAADTMWQAAVALKAAPCRSGGAWWEQGLTRQIEQLLELDTARGKIEFVFTVDFDTYMNPDDGIQLIRLMLENPQLDCVVPTQVRRGTFNAVLAQTAGPVNLNDPLVPIVHGHFGFTLFRRRVFENLSRPWFLNVPDPNGRWNEGRVDADIYFWQKFCNEGFKAAMATRVIVGHGDEGVCWPRLENGKVVKVWQSIFEWIQTRKPPEGIIKEIVHA